MPDTEHLPIHLGFADLRALQHDPLGFAVAFTRRYGDRIPIRFAGRSLLILSHPEDIHTVLVAQATNFHKGRASQRLQPLVGQGILTSDGAQHQTHRVIAQPVLTRIW
jgi:cytochrome P450